MTATSIADTLWKEVDWPVRDEWMQSDTCAAVIAEAAARHGVTPAQVSSVLERYIPDAATPRESIDKAAFQAADGMGP